MNNQAESYNFEPGQSTFRMDVLQGLGKNHKELPSKYFYDAVGSQLFDRICELDEYYPTRTELGIMRDHIHEIVDLLGPECMLIEYGSGSSLKTRWLLDHLADPVAYVPIDISKEQLYATATELSASYPHVSVLPVFADYTRDFTLPQPEQHARRKVAYYPGSTIGNFEPVAARTFLQRIAYTCAGGGLLIGVDLKKDYNILHRAYNDAEGVTAQFNMHLLERINNELDGDFQLDQFSHYALYNPGLGRIEMHLVSIKDQQAHVEDQPVQFGQGESIWTESSYKYTLEEFANLAQNSGFRVEQVWLDPQHFFSVQYLSSQYTPQRGRPF